MALPGSREQGLRLPMLDASGSIISGTLPQLVLAESWSRSHFWFQNTSTSNMNVDFGSARATCTITGGKVNTPTMTNNGFNFTKPPKVIFWGGGLWNPLNPSYLGLNQVNGAAPSRPAQGYAVLETTGGLTIVESIVITDPGAGYVCAPQVFLQNDPNDPYGCANPAQPGSCQLPAGGSIFYNGTNCPTDAIAVTGVITDTFTFKWMT